MPASSIVWVSPSTVGSTWFKDEHIENTALASVKGTGIKILDGFEFSECSNKLSNLVYQLDTATFAVLLIYIECNKS